jgi:tRNA(fMet)-specific endonuclease VapC
MASFLLDTNFCIHFIRGRAWARSALAAVQVLDVAISAVTVGELYEGAHRSDHPTKELAKTEAFLAPFEIMPLGREEAQEWGMIEARLRKEGNPIEAEDAMIAATARKHGLTLVTGNIKHFERVKGLKVVDWEIRPPKA